MINRHPYILIRGRGVRVSGLRIDPRSPFPQKIRVNIKMFNILNIFYLIYFYFLKPSLSGFLGSEKPLVNFLLTPALPFPP